MPTQAQQTAIAYLVSQLIPVIQENNPGASSDEVTQYATTLAGFVITMVLPNLLDSTGNPCTFNVPSDD